MDHHFSARKLTLLIWPLGISTMELAASSTGLLSELQALAELSTVDVVASEYIERPLLINGFKFDLRVYVLLTACSPMQVYIYEEGMPAQPMITLFV